MNMYGYSVVLIPLLVARVVLAAVVLGLQTRRAEGQGTRKHWASALITDLWLRGCDGGPRMGLRRPTPYLRVHIRLLLRHESVGHAIRAEVNRLS